MNPGLVAAEVLIGVAERRRFSGGFVKFCTDFSHS